MSDQSSHAHGPVVETGDSGLHGHETHGAHDAHHGGNAKYIYVFIALCFLTTVSFFTTSTWWHQHFNKQESWMLMMAVSCTKALLVIMCFMHLWWEANWKFVLTIPAAFMSLFLLFALVPDVGLRMYHASEERQFQMALPKSEAKPKSPAPAAAEHSP